MREKKYYRFDAPVKTLPADQLRAVLGGAAKSEIIRTIALNEKEFMTATEDRSLRGFWYATVKPVLSKLGLLSQKLTEQKMSQWDAELSRHLADLVRQGIVTYQDLRIVDTSRPRELSHALYTPASTDTYGFQVTGGEHPGVVLCTEKNTAVPIVRQVATITGCSWLSGGGQNALSAMEPLLRQIVGRGARHITFLSITDHDPAGWFIAKTFRKQAEAYREELDLGTIADDRLGIYPFQLSREQIEQNMFEPKGTPDQLRAWIDAGGGIDMQPYGLELDAFSDNELRAAFVDGLTAYLMEPSADYVRESYIRRVALQAAMPRLEEIISEIIERERENITVQPFSLFALARAGFDRVPIADLCSRDRDEAIADAVAEAFT